MGGEPLQSLLHAFFMFLAWITVAVARAGRVHIDYVAYLEDWVSAAALQMS